MESATVLRLAELAAPPVRSRCPFHGTHPLVGHNRSSVALAHRRTRHYRRSCHSVLPGFDNDRSPKRREPILPSLRGHSRSHETLVPAASPADFHRQRRLGFRRSVRRPECDDRGWRRRRRSIDGVERSPALEDLRRRSRAPSARSRAL